MHCLSVNGAMSWTPITPLVWRFFTANISCSGFIFKPAKHK